MHSVQLGCEHGSDWVCLQEMHRLQSGDLQAPLLSLLTRHDLPSAADVQVGEGHPVSEASWGTH